MLIKKRKSVFLLVIFTSLSVISQSQIPQHKDKPFIQDYSIKYLSNDGDGQLLKVVSDRNG
jgi:hypothetical protein